MQKLSKQIVQTGVPTLDKIIEGGFPRGSNILVAGQPGAGKTTFGLQFLYHGAKNFGEAGVYVSFVESTEKIKQNALRFGWDFAALEEKIKFLDLISTVGERGIKEIFDVMMDTVQQTKTERIVIDTITALTSYIQTKAEARTFIGLVNKFLERVNCTSLSFIEVPWAKHEIGAGFEEFMGDGLIILESGLNDLSVRRRLYIPKMRSVDHALDCYDLFITTKGIKISSIPSIKER